MRYSRALNMECGDNAVTKHWQLDCIWKDLQVLRRRFECFEDRIRGLRELCAK